jgi:HlyD family secretion protein
MKKTIGLVLALVAIAACGGGWAWWYVGHDGSNTLFNTAPVARGDIQAMIGATGTIEPEETVDIGAQVAGMIDYLGNDRNAHGKTVDYGSEVKAGQVLAHIDDSIYKLTIDSANAQLQAAYAGVEKAKADVGQMQAKCDEAEHDWDRAQKIGPSDALSQNDYDMYQANFATARANLGDANAAVKLAQASVLQFDAAVKLAQRNLDYCTIASPVDGTIIDRRVNVGQTVVSSLSAPSLFLIAKDLKRLVIWAAVNEADIAHVRAGMPVTFSVEAHPDLAFTGIVDKIRLNAQMTQNVVTYTVEVSIDNSNGLLLPYQTADMNFDETKRVDVLEVPNQALHWMPTEQQVAPDARDQFKKLQDSLGITEQGDGGPASMAQVAAANAKHHVHVVTAHKPQGTVWVVDGQFVRPITVDVGVTDDTNTEVSSPDIKEGLQVVTGDVEIAQDDSTGLSPK